MGSWAHPDVLMSALMLAASLAWSDMRISRSQANESSIKHPVDCTRQRDAVPPVVRVMALQRLNVG
jgi:hypothetical protein